MKRVRVQRIAGQLLAPAAARPPAAAALLSSCSPATAPSFSPLASPSSSGVTLRRQPARQQSTDAATAATESSSSPSTPSPYASLASATPATTAPGRGPSTDPRFPELFPEAASSPAYPSPLPERAHASAKLAALHARLALSQRLPLETLARCLVDASADPSPRFNNASLAYLGATLIHYHASEWLLCRYPRLPMVILYAAMKAYAGPLALADVARQWGVEAAAVPGAEVDPGLLQYSLAGSAQGRGVVVRRWGYQRAEAAHLKKYKWRHGISSRVVLDDDFGDTIDEGAAEAAVEEEGEGSEDASDARAAGGSLDATAKTKLDADARANFVRAVAGAVYAHGGGRAGVRSFVRAHVLSRQLDLSSLFRFKLPTRELAYLCAREGFAPPVARLEAETGRASRTPVFVVGIYSGADKLGEGAAASLDHARAKAAMNCLKAWYLYSPGEAVRVPSDMLVEPSPRPWEPAYVDIGEIL